MPSLNGLTLKELAVMAAWITENYNFKMDPETTSKTKILQIFEQLPNEVIEDALDSLTQLKNNPIRVTRMTSEMMISEGSNEQEVTGTDYDEEDLQDDDELIECAECGEQFVLIDSETEEVDCPECDARLYVSSSDESDENDEEE